MMTSTPIDFMRPVFEEFHDADAVIWNDRSYSYGWLLERIEAWQKRLQDNHVQPGQVCIIESDFSPNSIALFLSLIAHGCALVPITASVEANKPKFIRIAQGEMQFTINDQDQVTITKLPRQARHEYYDKLRQNGHPGLVLFSSGSTGENKAAVHDFVPLLEKFHTRRHCLRMMTFLLYDHIGGVNTLLYALSNGGCIVTVPDRNPDTILQAIERHGVELLPTSPTFLNLILLSEAYKRYDLSSLKTITYGTEPMPESTLKRIHEVLPGVRLQQTYGLSEVGILRSKSKNSDSLWLKVGGEGFETKVVNGVLWIRAKSAMMGYLNAPSPFDADGWMNTQDIVEVDGEYLRILGRQTEIINVGGEKVYPAEVESTLLQMSNIKDVTVYGERNPIMGQIVAARVNLSAPEDLSALKRRIRKFCRGRLQSYKIPVKIEVTSSAQYSARYKKKRSANVAE